MRYLTTFSKGTYTPEAWEALVKTRKTVSKRYGQRSKSLGELAHGWLAFGQPDLVSILHKPDNVNCRAVAVVFAAEGALKKRQSYAFLERRRRSRSSEKG